jgi:hypothetical protein
LILKKGQRQPRQPQETPLLNGVMLIEIENDRFIALPTISILESPTRKENKAEKVNP